LVCFRLSSLPDFGFRSIRTGDQKDSQYFKVVCAEPIWRVERENYGRNGQAKCACGK
jgi:hypothetical protein